MAVPRVMQHRHLVLLLLAAALLAAIAASDRVYIALGQILEVATPMIREHAVLGVWTFAILSMLSAVLAFFSTVAIVPIAVFAWGKPATIALLWGSWLMGAALSYWIGRRPGRRLVSWAASKESVARYEEKISARATFPLVLLFQLAVPSEIPGLVLGALHYDFKRYLVARAIAELPFAVGTVYLGDTFMRRQIAPLLGIAVGGVLLASAALHVLQRRLDH
jgi:uncharacterized membrane protein YdjX (TVP38/TMEM64 family)